MASNLRVRRAGTLHIDLPPEQAFFYFTAEGERAYIDSWDPRMADGGAEQERGSVFTTDADGELTIWTVLESDARAGRALYSRVTPGSRAGFAEVALTADGAGTRVRIGYDLTALVPEANERLAAFDLGFDAMLADWSKKLAALAEEAERAA
ncbi:SRPBCC family protein [Parasphingopyxis algicola]|uniref:SRPBCC family protein n=1 Tax=Parasphingopyxis algicola TaxID=2026624 RepID=UPI0015A4898E|nr:SRPBCC family protein [Parasphingopyxis algicola]QLC24844.1 SRPBCC family protein [Parasphingopyxis algicola]